MTSPRSSPYTPRSKDQIHRSFGRRLKALRQAQGWNQEDFASKIDMSVDAVSSMERGKTFASLETLSKIAAALKTEISSLFEFDVDTRSAPLRSIEALLRNQSPDVLEAAEKQVRSLVDLATHLKRR
jgi:transcriptional regulator with XRE-family HTH domain